MNRCIGAIFLLVTTASTLVAETPDWLVETGDFRQNVGTLQRLTSDTLELRSADNSTASYPLREVLRCRMQDSSAASVSFGSPNTVDIAVNQTIRINGIDMRVSSTNATMTVLDSPDGQQKQQYTSIVRQIIQANSARNHRGGLTLELTNGDHLAGAPVKIDGSSLIWNNQLLGSVKVPLDGVARLTRSGTKLKPPATAPAEDTVTLSNGDVVHGIMTDLSSATLSIQSVAGASSAIPMDSIQQMSFAQTAAGVPRPEHFFSVALVDGSKLAVSSLTHDGKQWNLHRLDGISQTLPAGALLEMEQIGGPVIWLSDLKPTESSNHTFLGRDWPPQFDRSVDGGPLRFETREFEHGIGVHAYSKMTFDVPAGFDRLHLSYAVDGEGNYADVTVRVWLDEQRVMEAPHVRAGTFVVTPIIALAGARRVALEVDDGDNQDIQDRFDWIEPAFLRSAEK